MSGERPVVAELGRPETPLETAERKSRDRALRRSRQTARNLVSSLLVCVALVAVIVLAVPRGDAPAPAAIDYRSAAQGEDSTTPLVAPKVPAGWRANAAEIRGTGGAKRWYVGFVTASQGFAAYSEGLPGSADWLHDELDQASPTGTTTVGGLDWRVYDRRSLGSDAGNVAYGLATRIGGTYLAVYGTASTAEVRSLAARVAADARTRGLTGENGLP